MRVLKNIIVTFMIFCINVSSSAQSNMHHKYDNIKWVEFEAHISDGGILSYKVPRSAKYVTYPEKKIILSDNQVVFAFLGYDPGGNSDEVSELWLQLAFIKYNDLSNAGSIKGLKRDLHNMIRVRGYEKGPHYVKQTEEISANNLRWYQVVWAEDKHPERISSDKYYLPYSSTHYLVISGIYGEKPRKDLKWLKIRRSIIRSVLLESKLE